MNAMGIKEKIMSCLQKRNFDLHVDDIINNIGTLNNTFNELIQPINEEGKPEWVSISDILYIDRESRFCNIVTRSGVYKHILSFEATQEMTEKYNFDVCDNRVIVNINQIKKFDGERGLIYFDDKVTKESVYTTMSVRTARRYRKELGEEKDISIKESVKEKGLSVMKKNLFNLL